MRFKNPLPSGYDVGWTRDNEVLHGYTPQQLAADAAQAQTGIDPTSEYPWLARGAALAIPPNVATNAPLLLADNYRNLLIFQNNSQATSPDVAPVLFISLDGPVQFVNFTNAATPPVTASYSFNSITLQPEEGLVLDTRVLTNAIYVAWGKATNTGGTVFTNGILFYGRTPNSPPVSPQAPMGISSSRNDPGNVGQNSSQFGRQGR